MSNIAINKSTNEDKKEIKRFYKMNHYPVSFMGHDHVYKITYGANIIGSAIVSYINKGNVQGLLHALLISEDNRGKGYAQLLIQHINKEHRHLICFADEMLKDFYNNIKFQEQLSSSVPNLFVNKYNSYLKKNKKLKIFTYNI